jgi:2-keto-4-pentenoate hydratase/2-oxohepta-3-ene-1,7-dioic acid hydratase in catechol pathway
MKRLIHFLDSQDREHWGIGEGPDSAIPIEADQLQSWFNVRPGPAGRIPVDRLLPPVPGWPPNIFGIGLNYRAHAAETRRPAPEKPLIFLKASTSVIGPQEPIVLPRSAGQEVDFEAELAVVIGRPARRVSVEAAAQHVLGYTCANDVTARDCQKRLDAQWARAKSFDTFCPLGPCLVSPHEFDPANADIVSTLNGQRMQDSHTSDMFFPVAELICYLSHQFTLLPWTVICTGTPGGVGVARTPPVFLRQGDRVAVTIEGIGTLANPVVADDGAGSC